MLRIMCAHRLLLGRSGREQAARSRMTARPLEELEEEAEVEVGGSFRGAEVTTASCALVPNGLQNHLCPRLINPDSGVVPICSYRRLLECLLGLHHLLCFGSPFPIIHPFFVPEFDLIPCLSPAYRNLIRLSLLFSLTL